MARTGSLFAVECATRWATAGRRVHDHPLPLRRTARPRSGGPLPIYEDEVFPKVEHLVLGTEVR